jgi:DNA invertase Pin-like site-specific DNA recombinase
MPQIMDGYIRVSRVQGREGEGYISPTVQREAIQRWAEYKDIEIGEWLIDEDHSGGTHNRPALKQGIERALAGETAGMVSWKIDRFSRTTEGGLRDLRRLQEAEARLAFVVEDIDTGTTYGKMVYTILLAVSEAFLESIKTSWLDAKSRAVKRGAVISRTPFGYKRCENGALEPDPAVAPIVAEAFRVAASQGLAATLTYLLEAFPARRWTTTKVRRLLSNRVYLGETRHGEQVQAGTHEALVSRSIWEASQTLPMPRATSEDFPLSGVVHCASCGAAMVGGRGGKGQRIYRCSASLAQSAATCPTGCVVTAQRLEDHLVATAVAVLDGYGADASIGENDASADLTELEDAEREALAELEAFAADLTMRRVMGERYHHHLLEREAAWKSARDAYRTACKAAEGGRTRYVPDDIAEDPKASGQFLAGLYKVAVHPGRGLKIEDRIGFAPLDGDRAARVAGA